MEWLLCFLAGLLVSAIAVELYLTNRRISRAGTAHDALLSGHMALRQKVADNQRDLLDALAVLGAKKTPSTPSKWVKED